MALCRWKNVTFYPGIYNNASSNARNLNRSSSKQNNHIYAYDWKSLKLSPDLKNLCWSNITTVNFKILAIIFQFNDSFSVNKIIGNYAYQSKQTPIIIAVILLNLSDKNNLLIFDVINLVSNVAEQVPTKLYLASGKR